MAFGGFGGGAPAFGAAPAFGGGGGGGGGGGSGGGGGGGGGGFGFGAPAAPPAADRMPAAQLVQIAQAFLQAYGTALSTANAAQLAGLYGADSVLCLDGQVAEGGANIAAQVITPRLAGGGISLRISKFDVQAVKATNQVLIFLTGEASAFPVSGAAPPLSRQPSRPRPPALPYSLRPRPRSARLAVRARLAHPITERR